MVNIRLNNIHIDEVTKSSAVFSGDNLQVGWRSIRKSNEGFGFTEGDKNKYKGNAIILSDRNFIEKYVQPKK